jgi:menaquinone-dependent protoporphyrinogen oxidase
MKEIIVYTTKHGCTEKAVKLIQQKAAKEIKAVNLAIENEPDLHHYDTIILGGPIYVGKLPKKLSKFIQQNLDILKSKRLALFLCAGEQDPKVIENLFSSAFSEELNNHAFYKEALGGELHLAQLSFVTKLILRIIKGINEDYSRLSEEKIERLTRRIII